MFIYLKNSSKKIAIIGCSGAGKTTLAKILGTHLGVPVYHLDQVYWRAGWREENLDVVKKKHAEICAQNKWIIDGNQMSTLAERIKHADTIIFLDMPRLICFARILVRWLRFHKKQRPDLTPGCFDRLNKEYLSYVWNYNNFFRPRILALLGHDTQNKRVFIIRNHKELEKLHTHV